MNKCDYLGELVAKEIFEDCPGNPDIPIPIYRCSERGYCTLRIKVPLRQCRDARKDTRPVIEGKKRNVAVCAKCPFNTTRATQSS